MKRNISVLKLTLCLVSLILGNQAYFVYGEQKDIEEMFISTCLDCHDQDTTNGHDFSRLTFQLDNKDTFRLWVKIHDQIESGAMPPKKKAPLEPSKKSRVINFLKNEITTRSREEQKRFGRAGIRRLSNLEFQNSIHDLFGISIPLLDFLPGESQSGFTTLANTQDISAFHITQYMKAIDIVLEEIEKPTTQRRYHIDYPNSPYMRIWFERGWFDGGDNTIPIEGAIVAFKRTDFIWRTDRNGFKAPDNGLYQITASMSAYQARSPVTFVVYKAYGEQSQPTYLKSFDLKPGESRSITLTTYLNKGEYILPSFEHLLPQPDGKSLFSVGAKTYQGEGIAMKSITVVGPLPHSTNLDLDISAKNVDKAITDLEAFIRTALRGHKLDPDWMETCKSNLIKAPSSSTYKSILKSILTSPQFLYVHSQPGPLSDHDLATRLSYFLTKSPSDKRLRKLAHEGLLNSPQELIKQADRLIDSPRFEWFIQDFSDQWLRLRDIDATTPDTKLYPEYNDILRQAMLDETRLFLTDLFRSNKKAEELIDSRITYVNRELAALYNINGIQGQYMRRVELPKRSLRGGLLSQAAIHKVSANGFTTSPIRRGNFVLSQLLGHHSPPPPPSAGSIEPDIRGTTTIREQLKAHRKNLSCQKCHQHIDPPGFALESFDPIGRFRSHYKGIGSNKRSPQLPVDASGTTHQGDSFSNFLEYKNLLYKQEKSTQAVVKNLTEQLVIYATGAEIQFADRTHIHKIMTDLKKQNGGLRSLLHLIITSELFTQG